MIFNKNTKLFFKDKTYRRLSIATLVALLNGTIVFHFVEGLKWIDALYFSVITLTTVGYGDIAPQTNFGKLFTIFYILTGIGIMFGFLDAIYQHRKSTIRRHMNSGKDKKTKADDTE